MRLGKKKEESVEREAAYRDLVISYKNTFAKKTEGKAVLMDLMNRFHILNQHGGDAFKEGQRSVVLFIMSQTSINMVELDKLLKGESDE